MNALRALEKFAKPIRAEEHQACELCKARLTERHQHVVDLQRRALCCACQACALLFEKPGAANGRYRTVPSRIRTDPSFQLTDEQWTALEVPVRLAFFLFNSEQKRWNCFYPSPAGATESQLPLGAWEEFASHSPLVQSIQPDVEALLVYSGRGQRGFECILVPIDTCYELVARVRLSWKGFGGGDAIPQVEAFVGQLRSRARPLEKTSRGGHS